MAQSGPRFVEAAKNGDAETVTRLISEGVNVNYRDRHNWQAIHYAARNGHTKIVELLVTTGRVEVNSPGYQNRTPLHYAVSHRHFVIMELLLSSNADCNLRWLSGETPLHTSIGRFRICCYQSNLRKCEYNYELEYCPLISEAYEKLPGTLSRKCVFIALASLMITKFNADVSHRTYKGKSVLDLIPTDYFEYLPLMSYFKAIAFDKSSSTYSLQKTVSVQSLLSAASGHSSAVSMQSLKSSTSGRQSISSRQSMTEASEKSLSPSVSLKSLESFASGRQSVKGGHLPTEDTKKTVSTSPLHAAAFNGNITEIKRLLFEGFDVNCKDGESNTAIHNAVQRNNPQVLTLLLDNGADLNAVNELRKSALHIAVDEIAVECIEILLQKECTVNLEDCNGLTPLMNAVSKKDESDSFLKSRQEQVIRLLIEKNRQIDGSSKIGVKCLHLAAKSGNLFAFNLFANENESLLQEKDKDGNTVLHHAVMDGRDVIINRILEQNGVDVNELGQNKMTPLHMAVMNSRFSTIELLAANHAKSNLSDDKGRTPLHYLFKKYNDCCSNSKKECCKHKDSSGLEPGSEILLHLNSFPNTLSKKCIFLAIAEFLIKNGADIHVKDSNGITPINYITGNVNVINSIISYFTLLDCRKIAKINEEFSNIQSTFDVKFKNLLNSPANSSLNKMSETLLMVETLKSSNSQLSVELESLKSMVLRNQEELKELTSRKELENFESNFGNSRLNGEEGEEHMKDNEFFDIFESLSKKDKEIEKLNENIAALKSQLIDVDNELQSLKDKNKHLESLVICSICKQGDKSFKLMEGKICDDCCEANVDDSSLANDKINFEFDMD